MTNTDTRKYNYTISNWTRRVKKKPLKVTPNEKGNFVHKSKTDINFSFTWTTLSENTINYMTP